MQYARVRTPVREAMVALEPTGWGKPYQALFDQTDVSGWEVWLAYSHNNANNPFQQADEQRYKSRNIWSEVFRDIVRDGGKGVDDKGRLNVDYVSHADTEWEKHHDLWMPKNGWYVPTEDGVFVPGTLIPFETVQNEKEAIKRLEVKGIPVEQVSYFWRLDRYVEEKFVGRGFFPDWGGVGRFLVAAGGLPSSPGDDGVASRPAYRESALTRFVFKPQIVMEVVESRPVPA